MNTQSKQESPEDLPFSANDAVIIDATASEVKPLAGVPAAPAKVFSLDHAQPLDPHAFPNPPTAGRRAPPATIANVRHFLAEYRVTVRYDVIRKRLLITMLGYAGCPDNFDNVAITYIVSLATLNGIDTQHIAKYVEAIGDGHQFNPVAEWIHSKVWDRVDRLAAFYGTLIQRADFPEELKQALMYRWALSAVAAALKPTGFRGRGVLTLQGPQSIGKTAWAMALVADEALRRAVIKVDHHLDGSNKDTIITAVTHWIVEIGELDSSFKRDVARLKGFLTADCDKVRRPYARGDSEYQRRTVFCASVNEETFLVDSTGNTRFWTIPVTAINYEHRIDMQQLWAQLAVEFEAGKPWWLTDQEEEWLEEHNKRFRAVSAIRELLLGKLDLDLASQARATARTSREVLTACFVFTPTNTQFKECVAVLRELVGEPTRINGELKWRVAFREGTTQDDDDDRY